MATLSTPMDQQLSDPANLNGWAKSIPGDPFPFNGIRSGRAPKLHQLSLLKNGLPQGIIPCFDTFALQSLLLSSSFENFSEAHGGRNGLCNKLVLFHKLPKHDITVDAAWPELYVDQNGKYWNVPESLSVELASDVSESALHYRLGLPGLYAKGSFSYQKSKDLWRIKETQVERIVQTEKAVLWQPAYDVRLREPHTTISAIVGGTFGAWLWHGNEDSSEVSSIESVNTFVANVSGTLSCTFQHGEFRNKYGDLTRIAARLHFPSLSGCARNISDNRQDNPASLPRLRLTFLQQVVGPLVFRLDTKHVLHSPWRNGMEVRDVILGLSYSFHFLLSGKVTVRYSPMKHKCKIGFEY